MKGAWLFFLLVLLSGCYSSSMMQTAKTLDKGESEVSLGVSGYLQPDAGGVAPDLMWRQGISDKSDMGVGYSVGFYGHARVDWKREIWSNPTNTTFLSTGLGFDGYFPNDFSENLFIMVSTYRCIFRSITEKSLFRILVKNSVLGLEI